LVVSPATHLLNKIETVGEAIRELVHVIDDRFALTRLGQWLEETFPGSKKARDERNAEFNKQKEEEKAAAAAVTTSEESITSA